jgi:CubicO group peptidase (beta-lactamase class C family)
MQLAGEKIIDIDKPVTLYLPEFKMKSLYGGIDAITTRLILTHSAGFPSDLLGRNSDRESHKDVVNYLNEQYTSFAPGYIRIYSNIGYCFLGYEIEKTGKYDYSTYINKRIFQPLGMNNSYVTADGFLQKKFSKTYDSQKTQKDESYVTNLPAGGIYSSVNDMGLFIRSWLQNKSSLLSTQSVNSIFEPQNVNISFNLGSQYGIGWDLKKTRYGMIAEHGGATFFYRAQLAINRNAGVGVIILSNSANGGSFTWRASEIVDRVCSVKGIPGSDFPEYNVEAVMDKNINLAEYQGNYGQNMSWYPLIMKDSALIGKPGNDSLSFILKHTGYFNLAVKKDEKWIDVPGQQFIFTKLNGERVFLAQAWGNWVVAAKQYPQQTITEIWKNRLGKYKVINYNNSSMFNEAELTLGENTLYITAKTPFSDQPVAMPFDIKSESLASVLGTSTYSGSMLQVRSENGIETIYFMGLVMQKI